MSKSKIKNKRSDLAGYRLHLERLRFSGKSSIRTMKFPLLPYEVNGKRSKKEKKKKYQERIQQEAQENTFFQDFMQSVRSDYENMYGPLNVVSYMKDKDMYSLKEFWVDSLRAGVTLHHTTAKRNNVLKMVEGKAGDMDAKQKERMKNVNSKFFDIIDFDKFKKEFILTKQKRKTANVENKIKGCINKDHIGKNNVYSGVAKEVIKNFTKDYKDLMSSGGNQEEYLKNKYGVDKFIYATGDDKDKVGGGTFYIYPDLNFNKDLSVEECIKRVDKFILDEKLNRKVDDLIGTADSFGGFSHYFNTILGALQNNEVEGLKNSILQMSDLWNGEEDDLRDRLQFLSEQASKIKKAHLVNNWHEYRSDIGGSIQSWVSNSLRQDVEIKNLLYGYEEKKMKKGKSVMEPKEGHLQEIKKVLSEKELGGYKKHFHDNDDKGGLRQTDEVIQLVTNLQEILSKNEQNINSENPKIEFESLQLYRRTLTDFREKFNSLYQRRYGLEEGEDDTGDSRKSKKDQPDNVKKKYPRLHKELPRIPQFLGAVKIKNEGAYEKYVKSYDGLKKGVEFLETLDIKYSEPKNENESDSKKQDRVKQSLQKLLGLYRNTDAKQLKHQKLYSLFDKYCKSEYIVRDGKNGHKDLRTLLDGDTNFIYRNERYARDKRGLQIALKYKDEELKADEFIRGLITELDGYKFNLENINKDNWNDRVKEWSSIIEIQKIKIGLASWFYGIDADFDLIKSDTLHYGQVQVKMDVYSKKGMIQDISGSYNTLIQTGILSEMKGITAQMSREKIIARYVVQPMASNSGYPLVMDEGDRRYYIVNKKFVNKKNKNEDDNKEFLDVSTDKALYNNKNKKVYIESGNINNLFAINSSKYQTQFLNNSLNDRLDRWKRMQPKLSEYSFIAEDTHKIDWMPQGDSYVPNCDKVLSKRLFVSVPFGIGKDDKQRTVDIKRQNKFIGIDIGEYGVAYYGLDGDQLSQGAFMKGFFYQADMRQIKEGIKENKEKQRAGTFTNPNTKIKALRDNSTTKIRNKIHQLVVENDALPIYEKEVSAFESGSGKISAIYNSIKRSDVYAELAADKLEHKLIWGNDNIMVGGEIGAYATSYMCSSCYDSIYEYISSEDYKTEYEVQKVVDSNNKIVQFAVGDNKKVLAHLDKKDIEKNKIEECMKFTGKETINFVRKYQRPSVKIIKQNIDKLPKSIREEMEEKTDVDMMVDGKTEKMSTWEYERGGQGVFRCAFVGCDKYSDADIQASMWIALKGYLQNVRNAYQKESTEQHKMYRDSIGKEEMERIAKGFGDATQKEQVQFILKFAEEQKISLSTS